MWVLTRWPSCSAEAGSWERTRSACTLARTGTHLQSLEEARLRLADALPVKRVEELKVPFQCVAASIERAAEHWFAGGVLADVVLASCAVPGILPPVAIGDEHFIDGGIVNSIPVARAVILGAKTIYVLQVGRLEKPLQPPRWPWEVGLVAFEVARRHRFASDLVSVPDEVRLHVLPTGAPPRPPITTSRGSFRSGASLASAVTRRPQPLIFARLVVAYFALELATLIACGALWLASGGGLSMGTELFQRLHYRLLRWFVHGFAVRWSALLGIDVPAPDPTDATRALESDRPLLFFSRHAGPGDTILLIDRFLTRFDRLPSVVFKRSIAIDPCLDLIGHRLPHAVLDTSEKEESEQQIEKVAAGLRPSGVLLLFPEGGNFTASASRGSQAVAHWPAAGGRPSRPHVARASPAAVWIEEQGTEPPLTDAGGTPMTGVAP